MSWFSDVGDKISGGFSSATGAITSGLSSAVSSIGKLGGMALSGITSAKDSIADVVSSIPTVGDRAGDFVYEKVNELPHVNTDKVKDVATVIASDMAADLPTIIATTATGALTGAAAGLAAGGVGAIPGAIMGGAAGAISSAGNSAKNAIQHSMVVNDESGKFNPEYAYKQYDFPDKNSFDVARSNGYTDFNKWSEFVASIGYDIYGNPIAVETTTTQVASQNNNINSDSSEKIKKIGIFAILLKILGVFK